MPQKMIPHSVRLSEEDSEFIAKLHIPGTVTSSDKIRAIIKDRREKNERPNSYEGLLFSSEEILLPVIHRLKKTELDSQEHSELMSIFLEWLMETTSYVAYQAHEEELDLHKMEQGVMERLSRVINATMRLGITPDAPCYEASIVRENLGNTLELAALISSQLKKENLND